VPAPPRNHTPSPSPPPADYIELPADTTCVKHGITEIPEQFCGRACSILGFKYTAAKPRVNMTGCFVLTDGPWKGTCNFNSNVSGSCPEPPCYVDQSLAQPLCIRK